jgi:GGDEF domain-containing protein
MPVLTGIDVLGIQRYVFASNRLRDSVAASWLVHWATERGGALSAAGSSGGQVLLGSGGNALIRFDLRDDALDFAAHYTRQLYEEAPGLDVVVEHFDYEPGGLAPAIRRLQVLLARAKLERVPSTSQLGISVTAPCRVTGLPASGFEQQAPEVPLSRMVLRWREGAVRGAATSRWADFLDGDDRLAFPDVIDEMGRTFGETSLIGVVHVDGNGIGEKVRTWLDGCIGKRVPDEEVLEQLREWSLAVDELGRQAFQSVVERVRQAVRSDGNKARIEGSWPDFGFELYRSNDQTLLPLRPVLLGGDDLTFICDGRIALDLAATALDVFSANIPHLGSVTACAGVAVVPAHAPFDRAYSLAGALCENAKRRRREQADDGPWLDWHVGTPRPGESVSNLRGRAYTSGRWELTGRPYRLGTGSEDRETWKWLAGTVLGEGPDGFRGNRWREHRNKVKELRAVVREGPEGVRRAREAWTVARELQLPGGLDATNGFLDGVRTPLLDAIELLDLHLPLGSSERSSEEAGQ